MPTLIVAAAIVVATTYLAYRAGRCDGRRETLRQLRHRPAPGPATISHVRVLDGDEEWVG